jgi:transcriptional regulator with XRE-family HTH domain
MERKIGDRIKELRQKANLTQAELADKMGFTSQTVSNWESGSREPDISALAKLSSLFNVSLDYLLLGKEEETIGLDDMDAEKRLSMLIKKDDVANFKKYDYQTSAYVFGRSVGYRNANDLRELNANTWKEIIGAKAHKIFDVCCDQIIKMNTKKVWAAFLVYDFIDDFVKMAIDTDRADVLETIGFRIFAIGAKPAGRGLRDPFSESNDFRYYIGKPNTYFISEDTFEYLFSSREKSPKCFEYGTTLELKIEPLQNGYGHSVRLQYTYTHLHNAIIKLAIKYKLYDLIRKTLKVYKTELDNSEIRTDQFYQYNNTYVCTEYGVVGRYFYFERDAIMSLLENGEVELAKELNAYNKSVIEKVTKLRSSYAKETRNIYVLSEAEIERYLKLHSNISDKERVYLTCINQKILVEREIRELRDLKLVRDILNNSYYNYYEFVFDSLTKNNLKELLKFFIDNDLVGFADTLIAGKDYYPRLLQSVWDTFALKPGYVGIKPYEELEKLIVIQNPIQVNNYGQITIDGKNINVADESKKLENNRLIEYIKDLKENIYKAVSNTIDAENQRKQDAIDRAKAVKGLTKDYFESLLNKNGTLGKKEERLFILDLCSLFDAILKFDFKCEGEDFFERMSDYFRKLEESAPQSRTMDDGWGYQVADTQYDEEVVIPERNRISHLNNIFSRLRIQRNNIAHSESKKVDELNSEELRECLEYVFSINKEAK